MSKKLKVVVCFSIIFTLLVVSTLNKTIIVKAKQNKVYSQYVTDVKCTQNGNEVTVSYRVIENVPGLASVIIGYEDSTFHFKKVYPVGCKGKHKVKFQCSGVCYRIYTQLTARNYIAPKNVISTYYNVSTGTSTHTVTKKEANIDKWSPITLGLGLSIIPAGGIYKIALMACGVSITLLSEMRITLSKNNYIVTNSTLDESKGNLKVTTKIYQNKKSYKKNISPLCSYSGTRHIGF